MRPPYGATNGVVAAAAGEKGFLYVVLWDVDTNDWRGLSASTIRDHVLSHAHNGAIVLMHLSAPNTAAALPGIITGLRNRGYELVTVSALLKGDRRFLDLPEGSDVGRAVIRMVDAGHMSGYDANYFGPAHAMTRGQLAKVAVLAAGLHTPEVEGADSPTFVDVLPRRDADGKVIAYPFDYVEEAAAAGILSGRAGESGQVFSPGVQITRGQLAQVVARMAREPQGLPGRLRGGRPGGLDVPDYAAADVALTAKLGLMRGYSTGRFDVWSSAQRGHVAVVMARFLDLPLYVAPPPTTTTTTARTTTTTTLPAETTTTVPPTTTTTTELPTTTFVYHATGALVVHATEASDVPGLMAAMVCWIRRAAGAGVSPVVVAGLAHYQFVTIHPYYDGNGRTARIEAWQCSSCTEAGTACAGCSLWRSITRATSWPTITLWRSVGITTTTWGGPTWI